jgi:WD40 repeat protein
VKTAPSPKLDPKQTHQVQELKHPSPLVGCRVSPDGAFVFAGAQDNAIVRWHLPDGKKTLLQGHRSWVRGLAFAGKEKLLFSGDYAGRILTWPLAAEKPAPLRTVQAHKGWVRALAVASDGKTLASCGNDGLVKLWSVADSKPIRELVGHGCHVYNVAFHPQGKLLASCDLKGVLKVWDWHKGTVERELDAKVLHRYDPSFRADIGGARGMAFSPDGKLLACCGITDVTNAFAGIGKPIVVLFDEKVTKPKLLLRPRANFQGKAWGLVFHPAGFLVAVGGGSGGALWFWKPDTAADVFTLRLPQNGRDLDLFPNGRLAVACADGAVRIYDLHPKK